jgi:hypothetical protein
MHQTPAFLLAALATLGSNVVPAQTETTVHINISKETCQIENLDVPCKDVGMKLRESGTPLNAHIRLTSDSQASYGAIVAAVSSLRDAGFNLKLGVAIVQPQ